ncbi:MAG: hypothetical protein AAB868_02540 [Patescibacteria group bacterium]
MKLKNFIFAGLFFVVVVCAPVVLSARENGTEECDAVQVEKILKQAMGITASTTFLSELKPTPDDTKKVAEDLVAGRGKELARISQDIAEMDRKNYDESIRHYFGRNSRSKLKNK